MRSMGRIEKKMIKKESASVCEDEKNEVKRDKKG